MNVKHPLHAGSGSATYPYTSVHILDELGPSASRDTSSTKDLRGGPARDVAAGWRVGPAVIFNLVFCHVTSVNSTESDRTRTAGTGVGPKCSAEWKETTVCSQTSSSLPLPASLSSSRDACVTVRHPLAGCSSRRIIFTFETVNGICGPDEPPRGDVSR